MVESLNKFNEIWQDSNVWLEDHTDKKSDKTFNNFVLTDELLTGKLEALLSSKILVTIDSAKDIIIDDNRAEHLKVSPGSRGLSRTVWLSANGKNVVYANTVISAEDTSTELLEDLKISTEALGNIAANSKLPIRRDNLEIGTVLVAKINEGFNIPSDKKLLGRRSRMFILDENNNSVLNASIIEVFHSDIIAL